MFRIVTRLCPIGIGALFLLILLLLVISWHNTGVVVAGGLFRPPYNGTYRLTSFFDHNYPNYGDDNEITIYAGESVADCSPHCYEGHPGIDWSMITGTQVLAAADGTVEGRVESPATGYGNRIVIRHDNGYRTLYAHFREHRPLQGSPAFNVTVGQRVRAGDVIGWSGSTGNSTGPHLHFGAYRGQIDPNNIAEDLSTDPFGWRGSGADPLVNYPAQGQGHTASCLWRSSDEDPVSCADTIVEDGGSGFVVSGEWLTSTRGNGFHMYYRRNVTATNIYASWLSTVAGTGPNQVYAFIPSQYATTHQATYNIWTGSIWETSTVDQQNYTDTWVLLGPYQLPAHYAFVFLYARTGELTNTTWIAADAIKFRSYPAYLPVVVKQPTPTPTPCPDC